MANLSKFIADRVKRKRPNLQGQALNQPILSTVGGQSVWVVDVLINSKSELLRKVAIPENNRQIRNYINEGTPLEIQKSSAGQFFVSGLSNIGKGPVNLKKYNIQTEKMAFSEGFKFNEALELETGNDNEVILGPESETEFSYSVETLTYIELSPYGSLPYGAKRIIRVS